MNRTAGLIALVALAAFLVVAVVGLNRPVPIEPASPAESMPAAPRRIDAGSLDTFLDAIHLDHLLKHGR